MFARDPEGHAAPNLASTSFDQAKTADAKLELTVCFPIATSFEDSADYRKPSKSRFEILKKRNKCLNLSSKPLCSHFNLDELFL